MEIWAAIILILALLGTVFNLIMGASFQMLLYYHMLFFISLGILMRIRLKSQEGEKERLQQVVDGLVAE
jgi:uncharacterized membrane protein